jgi:hypothetical protein
MRYWICDISGFGPESRFETDFKEPPAEGTVISPRSRDYRVSAVVRLPSETSPGVIEVERVTQPQPLPAVAGASYRPAIDTH